MFYCFLSWCVSVIDTISDLIRSVRKTLNISAHLKKLRNPKSFKSLSVNQQSECCSGWIELVKADQLLELIRGQRRQVFEKRLGFFNLAAHPIPNGMHWKNKSCTYRAGDSRATTSLEKLQRGAGFHKRPKNNNKIKCFNVNWVWLEVTNSGVQKCNWLLKTLLKP